MAKREKANKIIVYALILLGFNLLQNVKGLFPEIMGARCFLLLPAAIILAMGEDEKIGTFIGLFAGLLWDLSSSVHMGFNCIYIMLMCFISSALVTYIVRDIFITNMISSAVTIILYSLLYWLIFIIISGVEDAELTLFSFYIPCTIYTLVLTPVIYLLLKPIKKRFGKKEEVIADIK